MEDTEASVVEPAAEVEAEDMGMQQMTPADELRMLKQRAQMMGLSHSPNIGVETLRERINAKLAGTEPAEEASTTTEPVIAPVVVPAAETDNPVIAQLMAQVAAMATQIQTLTANPFGSAAPVVGARPNQAHRLHGGGKAISREVREEVYKEQMKLVRIRITCLDPKKKDLPGEVITIGNEAIGTVRKYIPYGDQTENGYHVPFCIYTFLKDKKFLNVRTRQDPRTKTPIIESGMVREYAIEELPMLTTEELKELARQQAASDSIDRGEKLQ